MTHVADPQRFRLANSDISNVSQPKKELTMNAIGTTNTDLHSMLLKGKTALIRAEIAGSALRRHGGLLPKALVLQLRAAMRQRSPRLRMSWV